MNLNANQEKRVERERENLDDVFIHTSVLMVVRKKLPESAFDYLDLPSSSLGVKRGRKIPFSWFTDK